MLTSIMTEPLILLSQNTTDLFPYTLEKEMALLTRALITVSDLEHQVRSLQRSVTLITTEIPTL